MSIMQLFKSEQVEFQFQGSINLAMQKLAEIAQNPKLTQSADEAMLGEIREESTYLYRSIKGSRNSFKPTFYGRFSEAGGNAVLTGEICLNRVVKKFILFWCGIVLVVALVTLFTILQNPNATWGSLLHVIIMLIACIIFFHIMIKKSLPDIDWLKNEISRVASDNS